MMDQFDTSALALHRGPDGRRSSGADDAPIICFSHLRWSFVFQRPQHLLTQALKTRRVVFWEEPHWTDPATTGISVPALLVSRPAPNLMVVAPVLRDGLDQAAVCASQAALLADLMASEHLDDAVLWYYTPAALNFSDFLNGGRTIVYDIMDELSAFAGADPALPELERRLLEQADVVFTGGFSLYEAKCNQHDNIHAFPSGVDVAHFRPAREPLAEPIDQAGIPHPRLGFYGVIDERFDIALLGHLAVMQPSWHFVMVGPVVKIDMESLPRAPNIHYLGAKTYSELPAYLAGWDVALLPFARNQSTRFISPTKTPEYLAGGRPVVSTPITDVVRHYGHVKGVGIADSAPEFAKSIEAALALAGAPEAWLPEADELLASCSWRGIWSRMSALIKQAQQQAARQAVNAMRAQRA